MCVYERVSCPSSPLWVDLSAVLAFLCFPSTTLPPSYVFLRPLICFNWCSSKWRDKLVQAAPPPCSHYRILLIKIIAQTVNREPLNLSLWCREETKRSWCVFDQQEGTTNRWPHTLVQQMIYSLHINQILKWTLLMSDWTNTWLTGQWKNKTIAHLETEFLLNRPPKLFSKRS